MRSGIASNTKWLGRLSGERDNVLSSELKFLGPLAAMAASNALTTSQSERLMDSCKTSPSVSRGTPLTRATSSAET